MFSPVQNDEQLLSLEERRGPDWAPGALDPLLKILAREFIDHTDLAMHLKDLFNVSANSVSAGLFDWILALMPR
jgi:hypothetical protein